MLICKNNTSYKCSRLDKWYIGKNTKTIHFSILDCISPTEARDIFIDNTFYFYDDVLKGRLIETNNTKLVGLSITYNADSTCNIKMNLKEGVVNYEN